MDLKQLKALVTVVEVGSVTRAAELLHLVQPAVTRQIRTLEQELGMPLFERTRHGMRPTAAGENLAERARRALVELDRARAELAPTPGVVSGIVTLGLLESAAELLAASLVSAILRDHPGIELRLLTAYSGQLQRWLDDGDVDLSLLYDLTNTPSLNVTPLVHEKLWAVAAPASGLDPAKPVPFAEVAAHPLIVPTEGHALRTLVEEASRQAGVEIDISVQTNAMSLQKHLALGGHGWTVLPGIGIAGDVANGTLSAAPVREPEVWRTIVLGLPRAGRVTPAVEVVARELTGQIRRAVQDGRWPSARLGGPSE
ncbi:LysR family transcriptional regulator [Amycolatopsis lurida]